MAEDKKEIIEEKIDIEKINIEKIDDQEALVVGEDLEKLIDADIDEPEENKTFRESIKTDYNREPLENLRVSADGPDTSPEERKRRVKKLAGAISHSLRTNGEITIRAFGNKAIAKGAKALAIAKGYLNDTHKDIHIAFSPAFIQTEINGNNLTGIAFCVFTVDPPSQPIDVEQVKSKLFVKADPDDIAPEDRKRNVRKLAGAITHAIEENKECVVRCFGYKSIGKAAKALAIARGFVATKGPDLYCWSTFIVTKMNDSERTGIGYYTFANN